MLGSSNARARLVTNSVLLSIIFVLALIVIGTVGVNGRVTFSSTMSRGCLLYMADENGVVSSSEAYCLMPIIGSAVVAFFALVFLLAHVMVLRRHDEFFPWAFSLFFMGFSALLCLLSFAICGEIGIGLNRGCRTIQDPGERKHCRSQNNFSALYVAEICAGLMAGFWIIVIFFEFIQCKRVPRKLAHGAGWDAHGASQAQPDQITVKPNTMANTQHAESDRPPETAYDPNYAQQQGYTPSPHLQPHTAYPPTPDASIVAGPKTELSGTLNTGDKSEYHS